MSKLIELAFKTVVGRWVTAILVTTLLGTAGVKFHNWKEDLIHKGQQVCVQEINKETVQQLQDALAAEKSARADLAARLAVAAAAEQEARERRRALETKVGSLERAMAEQRKNDETYRDWSDAPLPDGVAARLRSAQARDNPSPIRDDRN